MTTRFDTLRVTSDRAIRGVNLILGPTHSRGQVLEGWIRSGLFGSLKPAGRSVAAVLIALAHETDQTWPILQLPRRDDLAAVAACRNTAVSETINALKRAGVLRRSQALPGRWWALYASPADAPAPHEQADLDFRPRRQAQADRPDHRLDPEPGAQAERAPALRPGAARRAECLPGADASGPGPAFTSDGDGRRPHQSDPSANIPDPPGAGGDPSAYISTMNPSPPRTFGGVRGGSSSSSRERIKHSAAAAGASTADCAAGESEPSAYISPGRAGGPDPSAYIAAGASGGVASGGVASGGVASGVGTSGVGTSGVGTSGVGKLDEAIAEAGLTGSVADEVRNQPAMTAAILRREIDRGAQRGKGPYIVAMNAIAAARRDRRRTERRGDRAAEALRLHRQQGQQGHQSRREPQP